MTSPSRREIERRISDLTGGQEEIATEPVDVELTPEEYAFLDVCFGGEYGNASAEANELLFGDLDTLSERTWRVIDDLAESHRGGSP